MSDTIEKIKCLIIGSGPAGYTAAIYASRANMNPVLYQGTQPGGQLTTTNEVENFPGYPDGITGPEMMIQLQEQAKRFGTDIRDGWVTKVDFSGNLHKVWVNDTKELHCDTVIISTGASAKYLGLPYEPFLIDPSAKVFHYGQAVYEGMKAYKDDNDDVWLFRPYENFERINKSAVRLAMPEIPESIFIDGLKALLNLEKDWVKKGVGNSLYIRPFIIATGNGVIAQPSTQYRFMIILSPAKSYYSGDVKVIVAEHYSRAANGGVGAAKAAGNYAAQFYPTKLANEEGFQQIIWTDDATHTKLEEAGTMNVFFRINDALITAPAGDRILDGVTRKSIIDIAKKEGINVEVRDIVIDELTSAAKNGTLKEIFGAGTAAVVSPISGFSYKNEYFEIQKQEQSLAMFLKEKLTNIQYKIEEDTFGWTIKI